MAYREELEASWWEQWKVQCFDSLIPTKSWTKEKRGVKVGDVVLISYTDKSKTGTYKMGVVDSVEIDIDGLVRTCEVRYRLVRSDLPVKDLRLYFKGLTFKKLRVPVLRLCVILPIEEQRHPDNFLTTKNLNEDTKENRDDYGAHIKEKNIKPKRNDKEEEKCLQQHDLEEVENMKLNDPSQEIARNSLVGTYRLSLARRIRVQHSNRSVRIIHKNFSDFSRCQALKK